MKYIDKYPSMRQIIDIQGNIMRDDISGNCFICGSATEYIEINYEAYFCSEECLDAMDNGELYGRGKHNKRDDDDDI